jgi:polysaccharide biosynthesis/export protein
MNRHLLIRLFLTQLDRRFLHLNPVLLPLLAVVLMGASGCVTSGNDQTLPAAGTSPAAAYEKFDFTGRPASNTIVQEAAGPYRLGVGDVLSLSVYGEEGSVRDVPVDPNGNIAYMLVGTVPAAGHTIDEIRASLQKLVSTKLSHGIVNVVPVRFGSQTFTILGELNYPGTYLLEGNTTVLDAIAKARGIRTGYFRNSTSEMADFQHATLMRKGQLVSLDFDSLLHQGNATQNLELRNGDIITIPSSLVRSIYVLGEVNFPRTIGFFSAVSLVQALTEARGLKSTSDGRIIVVRGSLSKPEARVVNYYRIIKGRESDIRLTPGDILYVPPRRFELLRDIVQAAISAYATTVSAESATKLYLKTSGTEANQQRPIIVP